MIGVILQARLDSTRLPRKALLPLDNKPVILRVMEALNNVPADTRILACPQDSLSTLKPLAEEAGFHIFSGPKEDVLERFCMVIRHFSLKRVIRATGDNPFVFADGAILINNEAASLNADYSCYSGLPYGAGVESVSAAALLKAAEETNSVFDREHVCPYLYNNPQMFKLHRPLAPIKWQFPDIRVTIDTHEDYERAKQLYIALNNNPHRYNGSTIIEKYTNTGE